MAAKRAFVVGISNYNAPSSILKAMVPEAENWTALLKKTYGFAEADITCLFDEQATLEAVERELKRLLDAAGQGDQLALVYCGHGTVIPTGNGIGDEALILFHPPGADPNATALTDTALAAIIKDHPAPGAVMTIILEACFTGGFEPPVKTRLAVFLHRLLGLSSPAFLSLPIDDAFRVATLETIHRFGSLRSRPAADTAVWPLVIAACQEGKKARQLPPQSLFAPPRMLFSSRAIPELKKNYAESHVAFRDNVNALEKKQPDPQIATLVGNRSRDSQPFLT